MSGLRQEKKTLLFATKFMVFFVLYIFLLKSSVRKQTISGIASSSQYQLHCSNCDANFCRLTDSDLDWLEKHTRHRREDLVDMFEGIQFIEKEIQEENPVKEIF